MRLRSTVFDIALAAALWAVTCLPPLSLEFGPLAVVDSAPSAWAMFALSSALVLPLAWRRSHPTVSGGIVVGLHVLQLALGVSIAPANISALFTAYALAAYGPRWAGRAALVIGLAGSALAPIRYGFASPIDFAVFMLLLAVSVLASWLLGKLVRSRREIWRQMSERAERLEREREQERSLAAADERTRIAREMHDIVAHSLSVIVAQADGGSYAASRSPEQAREALRTIARTGRDSLAEMRRLLGVLRDGGPATAGPTPSLADIDALIGDVRRSGVEIEVLRVGALADLALPQGAELAVYRVVQEALTNVMKHAGPGVRAVVRLERDDAGLLVAVLDDGRGAAADPASRGSGQGVRGMAERVGLYGGTLVAQPRIGGGFEVRAHFPQG
ncbi:sensor histidine kinase [Leucobacter weissii]|uniref:histidine kinase n=1 Tax=Leucobacter weissii TaxID=1983706 RepID=A0A939MGL0_9MICO|nr:sensor histidine kinase [Leucobacter weissii]MBO1900513.1 sensor histidine kinase [Leucobacter weissii]